MLMLISAKQECVGIMVYDFTDAEDSTSYFAKITSALELIAQYQPRRLDRIRRDLRRILVWKRVQASYWHLLRACTLTPQELDTRSDIDVALSIVHEATHARIDMRGIRYKAELRERIERACVDEEIQFANLVPDGPEHVEYLSRVFEKPWYSDEQLRQNKIEEIKQNYPPSVARWFIKRLPP